MARARSFNSRYEFQAFLGKPAQKPRLPKKSETVFPKATILSTFWAKPASRYPFEPQYIVLFD